MPTIPARARREVMNAGFALTEWLVTMSVILLLLFLLLPAVARSREAARRTACAGHLKQISQALHNYHDAFQTFPPGASSTNQLSWHVFVLPQLGEAALYSQFSFAQGEYYSATPNQKNNPHGLVRIEQYSCPSSSRPKSVATLDLINDQHPWTTHFVGIMGPRGPRMDASAGDYPELPIAGPFAELGLLTLDVTRAITEVTDGASNTFVVGELSWNNANGYRTWVRGNIRHTMSGSKNVVSPIGITLMKSETDFNDLSLGSEHPGGTHVLMGDGAVRFLDDSIDLLTYKAMASINGGETSF
jgi:type II secretory pathway pseudopilin PulG